MPKYGNAYLNIYEQIDDPKPNETIEIAITNALCFDLLKNKRRFFTGVTYPIPSAIPHRTPHPKYKSQIFFKYIAKPEKHNPIKRRNVDNQAAIFIFFSTRAPKVAAPLPKNKIFKQNIN